MYTLIIILDIKNAGIEKKEGKSMPASKGGWKKTIYVMVSD
jgi:hypothetical protein